MNVIKTLRNNWKKTVFLIGVSGFGINYGLNKYRLVFGTFGYCFLYRPAHVSSIL